MPWRTEAYYLPREDVGAQYAPNDISEMGNIVHIRQSTSDQDVPCAFLRQGLPLALHLEGYLGGDDLRICSAGPTYKNVA